MKHFDVPRMEVVRLTSSNVLTASLCNVKYCDGFICNECEDVDCLVVSPCEVHNCSHVLCPMY